MGGTVGQDEGGLLSGGRRHHSLHRVARHGTVNHRMLYFFHHREVVVISHGFEKQQAVVPSREIDLAIERKLRFAANPAGHTHWEIA